MSVIESVTILSFLKQSTTIVKYLTKSFPVRTDNVTVKFTKFRPHMVHIRRGVDIGFDGPDIPVLPTNFLSVVGVVQVQDAVILTKTGSYFITLQLF